MEKVEILYLKKELLPGKYLRKMIKALTGNYSPEIKLNQAKIKKEIRLG